MGKRSKKAIVPAAPPAPIITFVHEPPAVKLDPAERAKVAFEAGRADALAGSPASPGPHVWASYFHGYRSVEEGNVEP